VQVFSSRDQQLLVHTEPGTPSYLGDYAYTLADLGVQPASPYPVFALTWSSGVTTAKYLEVWRCNPSGVQVTGTGCSSAGPSPTVGVRRVDTPLGEQSRIVLGSAPPGALAWCLAAPANANTFAGLSLPLALDPFGFPGCSLLVPPSSMVTRLVGSSGFDSGYAEVDLTLHLVPAAGLQAASQWLVLDPSTLGFAATPRCTLRVQ